MAAPPPVIYQGSDADGDVYTITLAGGGSMTVTPQGGGGIASISVSGTTGASSLSIKVRRTNGSSGAVALGELTGQDTSSLKSFIAPAVDLVGAGITMPGAIRTINVRDLLSGADMTTGGSAADTLDLKIRFVSNTEATAGSALTFAGRVTNLSVAAAFFVNITAPSMGQLVVRGATLNAIPGNATSLSLNLTATDVTRSLDSATITGAMSGGAWSLARGSGRILASSIDANWTLTTTKLIEQIRTKGLLDGTVTAGAVRSLIAGGTYAAAVTTNKPADFAEGIGSLRALNVADGELNAPNQTIGSVFTHDWADGGISALSLGTFRCTEGKGFTGGLARTEFRFNDDSVPYALGRFEVEGLATGSTVRVDGDTRSVRMRTVSSFRFFCGTQDGLDEFPSSVQDFNLTRGRIDSFVISDRFRNDDFGNPINSIQNLQVGARNIGSIRLTGRIRFTNSGAPFGIASLQVDRVAYSVSETSSVTATNLDQTGSGQALAKQDFVVRII